MLSLVVAAGHGYAQPPALPQAGVPRVLVPTGSRPTPPVAVPRAVVPTASGALYPWRLHVTITTFWIGEQPSERNPVANLKSSWDQNWMANYGGYDLSLIHI